MKRLSKRAAGMSATTAPQAMEGLKTQVQSTMTELNTMMQQMQGSVAKMGDMMRAVDQLQVQVEQLEQARLQTQQTAQKNQQAGVQQADDQAIDWKTMLGKSWQKAVELFGPERTYEDVTENAVAGVRGSKKDKSKAFWKKNLDYGKSPYGNMDKLETITDDRSKKSKAQVQYLIFRGLNSFSFGAIGWVKVVRVETSEIVDTKAFRGKDPKKVDADLNIYLKQMQTKYPSHRVEDDS